MLRQVVVLIALGCCTCEAGNLQNVTSYLRGVDSQKILPKIVDGVERSGYCTKDLINEGLQWLQDLLENYKDCGKVEIKSPNIAGGERIAITEVPWHVGIYTKDTRPYMQVCGGTLISNDWVISAAHCFWKDGQLLPAGNFAVGAGKQYRPWNDPNDEAQKSEILKIRIPPRFGGASNNLVDDIAMLSLATPVTFNVRVQPICISYDKEFEAWQLQPGKLGRVSGWGHTSKDGPESQVLMMAEVPYVSLKQCRAESPREYDPYIGSDKICAGYQDGTAAVCKGDSGGGLVFPAVGEIGIRYFLRGVASSAPKPLGEYNCNDEIWGIYTKISKHEDFIKGNDEIMDPSKRI